ncbi:MAG TPA: phosphatidate cytidylyltransferase, partial [Thermoanaerobaculia bacterium]|nr:phosphatidate cytidylyltransferase [Thermoanaerobaculia bacterium]
MTDAPAVPFVKRYPREITSLVAGPVLIWIIGWSHAYLFDATIALIGALALHEFLSLGRKKGYEIPIALCIGVMVVVLAAFVLEDLSVELGVFVTLLIIPASYVFSKRSLEDSLPSSAIAVLATLYVGMLGGSLIRLRNDFPEGPRLVFFLLLVV